MDKSHRGVLTSWRVSREIVNEIVQNLRKLVLFLQEEYLGYLNIWAGFVCFIIV